MSIAVKGLGFAYCTRSVLTDISFLANDGQLVAVLGPNGVGKTTLFGCILGLRRHYTGMIAVDGVDARTLSPRERAHRLAHIPQTHDQTFSYSVTDMVLMGTSHRVATLSVPRERELAAARTAMERVGILPLADKSFSHLSGGEQQLVLIARALAQEAQTLLMDEPTSSLDYGNQDLVLRQARSLADEGYTVLLSTHNPQHALWYADAALLLLDGRVAAFGAPERVMDAAIIERLYGVSVEFVQTKNGPLIAPAMETSAAKRRCG